MNRNFLIAIVLVLLAVTVAADDYINVLPDEIRVENVSDEELSALQREYMVGPGGFDPAASSVLPADSSASYGPENVVDGDPGTSWSEGVDGSGIGETLFVPLYTPRVEGDPHLYILPGWGGSASTRERNNRVARARTTVYGFYTFSVRGDLDWGYHATVERFVVTFDDAQVRQGFPIGRYIFPDEGPSPRRVAAYLILIEILETYPGSQWDDTVVAEVEFSPESLAGR